MGDGGGGHWLVWMAWRPAGWSVCLPLLISRCTIKSRSSLLALVHPSGPGKSAIKQLWWWCGVNKSKTFLQFAFHSCVLMMSFCQCVFKQRRLCVCCCNVHNVCWLFAICEHLTMWRQYKTGVLCGSHVSVSSGSKFYE